LVISKAIVAEEVRRLGAGAMVTPYDLADADSIEAAVTSVINQWDGVDVLVHAALRTEAAAWGIGFEDQSIEGFDADEPAVRAPGHRRCDRLPCFRREQEHRGCVRSGDGGTVAMAGREPSRRDARWRRSPSMDRC
jgi:hypothetical protein